MKILTPHLLLLLSILVSNESMDFFKILTDNSERAQHHDLILCGNFTQFLHSSYFFASNQLALTPDISSNLDVEGLDKFPQKLTDGLLIFLFTPASMMDFYQVLDKITQFYETSKRVNPRQNLRMYFLTFPSSEISQDIVEQDPYLQNTLLNQLRNDKSIATRIKRIPQNDHVYAISPVPNPDEGDGETLTKYQLVELYGIEQEIPVTNVVPIQNFNQITPAELVRISPRRHNFFNTTLKIVAEPADDYETVVAFEYSEDRKIEFTGGSGVYILKDLQKLLNFSYTAIAGTGWTSLDSEGRIHGLGGQIFNKEADFCISSNLLQVDRSKYIWFLQPVISEEVEIFFLPPTGSRNIFSLSFRNELWYAIMITFTILSLSVLLVMKIQKDSSNWVNFELWDIPVWIVSTLCQQGWVSSPTSFTLRILFIIILIASLVLYSSYTAAFVATISVPDIPIKRYSDFEKFNIEAFMDYTITDYAYYFVSDKSEVAKIVERSKKLFTVESDALDMVIKPGSSLALIIPVDQFYTAGKKRYNDTDLCEINHIRGNHIARSQSAMFLRKWSDYKEFFGHTIIFLMERGLNTKYWSDYKLNTRLVCHRKGQRGQQLGLPECYFAFAALFIGLVLASLCGLIEQIYHRSIITVQILDT